MMRLAVISECSPFDRKGQFNAVHNRIRHLKTEGGCEVDAFCIHSWDTAFTRKVRHTPYIPEKQQNVTVDDITYHMLWYDFSIIDHITVEKLHRKPVIFGRFISRALPLFEGYDAVIAHSFTGALFAEAVKSRYGIPYFVTWHGSDIHTHPSRNPLILETTRRLMQEASYNFFVSRTLMAESGKITSDVEKDVLYNGVSEDFVRFSDIERTELRNLYGLGDDKVVAFVGNLSAVKNVDMLQPIFHEVRSRFGKPLKFLVVGDGKMHQKVEQMFAGDVSIDVRMMGNRPAQEMPSIMNCIDVLVLPSRNEGLPLVCLEAMKCGAAVAGADVGGVAEVIGKENVVPHGPGFLVEIASKVVCMLESDARQVCPDDLDWKKTAAREMDHLRKLIIFA